MPGRTVKTSRARAVERVAEAGGECIEARLGRAVDEVRRPRADTGDAREGDQGRRGPCAAQLIGDGQTRADRASEVDVDQVGGGNGDRRPHLRSELAKGLNDDVEVAVLSRDRGDPVGVRDRGRSRRSGVRSPMRRSTQLGCEASGICRVQRCSDSRAPRCGAMTESSATTIARAMSLPPPSTTTVCGWCKSIVHERSSLVVHSRSSRRA